MRRPYVPGQRRHRRDQDAAAILDRANGECDNCGTKHGERHGPLIACWHGIAACRDCQRRLGFTPYGASLCPGEGDRRDHS